jgi:hypothetical protein
MSAVEAFQSFRKGWTHAAALKPRDVSFAKNAKAHIRDEYNRGYDAAETARRDALAEAATRTGYDLEASILRR